MPEPDAILQETGRDPGEITNADVIVGIPTYNNAETIEAVVEAAVGGLSNRLSYTNSSVNANFRAGYNSHSPSAFSSRTLV